MEEELKELEESIKEAYRCYDYDLDYNPLSKGIAEMIEHLIKAYKEIKEIEESHRKENGELRERIKELEEENQQLEAIKDETIRRYNFESIPVSLVQEKIAELWIKCPKNSINVFMIDERNNKIEVLEELLEKRK